MKVRWGEDIRAVVLAGSYRGQLVGPGVNDSVLELTSAEVRVLADARNSRWAAAQTGDVLIGESACAIVADNQGHVVHFDLRSGLHLDGAPGRPVVAVKDWHVVQKLDGKLVVLGSDHGPGEGI